MSSILSSPAANPTGGCSSNSYTQLPTQDIACAVAYASPNGLPSSYSDLMKGCCKDAPVESYAGNCGLYCLSVGQSVADLTACFQGTGINPGYIMCNGNLTATATGKPDRKSRPTGDAANPGQSSSVAAALRPQERFSKAGLGMLAMLILSAATGALF